MSQQIKIKNGPPSPPKIKNFRRTIRRLSYFLATEKLVLGFAFLAIILATLLQLFGPLLLTKAINQFIMPGEFEGLGRLLLLMMTIYVLSSIFFWLQDYLTSLAAQKSTQRLRQKLFNHIQLLPLDFFDKQKFGDLMSRLTNDITNISTGLSDSLAQSISAILSVCGALFFMFYLSPLFAAITLLIVPLTFLTTKGIVKKSSQFFLKQSRDLGDLNAYIEEIISGQKTVKVFTHEAEAIQDFKGKNDLLRNSGFWAQFLSGIIPVTMVILTNLNYVVIAFVGGYLAIRGQVTVGVLAGFIQFSNLFTRPLGTLANQINSIQQALASAERVFEILDEPIERDRENAKKCEVKRANVEFKNVSFGYRKSKMVLDDISFKVNPGETVALIGPTGSGKTSIVNLLNRFYEPNSGHILIDGQDIGEMTLSSVRSQMAAVLQDTRLFADTIRENIRFGRLEATDEEVELAANQAAAADFILGLKDGYETILTNDGTSLSQGQRQLLAIARAILADPKILILDEATASIDTMTEAKIEKGMERLKRNRTTLLIAHRLSTVKNADLILVIKSGKIIEQGTHKQLLKKNGFYNSVYNSQFENADFDLIED